MSIPFDGRTKPGNQGIHQRELMQDRTVKSPKVFISYSWTSKAHGNWVLDLAIRLCDD
jgi:hypothetical protein